VAPSGLVNPDDPITNSQGQLVLFYTPPDVAGTGDLGKIDEITIQIGGVSLTLEVYGFRGSGLDYDEFLNVPYVAE
jgi:hypothetical protein